MNGLNGLAYKNFELMNSKQVLWDQLHNFATLLCHAAVDQMAEFLWQNVTSM